MLAVVLGGTIAQGKPRQPKQAAGITAEEQMRLDYYLYAALDASDRKEHAKAYFMLELCHQIDPTNPTVCSMIGAYQQSLYGVERALPLLKTAYEGSPSDYYYRYVTTAYEAGQHSTAIKVLQQMEKRQPRDIDILELHEQILLREKKYKQALAIRDKVDKLTGEPTVQSVYARYETYRSMGKNDQALKVLDDYLSRNPNDGRMQAMRTDIDLQAALQHGDSERERELLFRQLHNNDVSLRNKLRLLSQHSQALGFTAAEKRLALQDLREQYPFEQEIYQALLDHERQSGNAQAALEVGRTMLTMNPTDSQLREQVADLMRDDVTVTPEEFAAFIDQSYTILPDDPKWGYFKAMLCMQRQDTDSALIVLSHALEYAREPMVRLELLVSYGDMLGFKERYEEAFAAYDEALQLAPDHLGVLNNYAWSLAISGGDLKRAEKMSQRTIQKEANNPTYLDTYAWILHLQGQDALALFYIKKAMEYMQDRTDDTINSHYETIRQAIQ